MSGSMRLHNPGQFEQVFDTAGHVLAGGESRVVTETDDYTDTLISRGVILSSPAEPSLIARRKKTTPQAGTTEGN
ncbi:hypothetical protein Jinkies_16 [Arthrobacter phage Jinkies]|uniref:Uncharacterized protein n=1 Tax=Arthrobacter phage Jinkies TaxID=2743903 RepID=A0A7S5WS07_9CAUD|nr:hypothetical protein Jinkies_16 [Arthrobacter phage Jinkies]